MNCDLLSQVCPDARLQGTVQALFVEGKFDVCNPASYPTNFKDLKTISGFSLQQEPEFEDRYKYTCGKKEIVGKTVKQNSLMFQTTLMDLTLNNIKLILRGKDVSTTAQTALTATTIDPLDFSTVASISDQIYFLSDSSNGSPVALYNIESLIITSEGTPLVEGVDYVFRKSIGAVKFITVQNTILDINVTAEATILNQVELGSANVTQGFMRILYFPTEDTIGNPCEPEMIIDAVGFISFEDEIGMNVDETAEAAMNFSITGNPRITDLRQLTD